jgi:hypothetical protein
MLSSHIPKGQGGRAPEGLSSPPEGGGGQGAGLACHKQEVPSPLSCLLSPLSSPVTRSSNAWDPPSASITLSFIPHSVDFVGLEVGHLNKTCNV